MASPTLERKTNQYALGFKRTKIYPAVVIGAEFSYYKRVDKSKPVCSTNLVNKLRKKLLKLGTLYTTVNGNSLGCCAEVNAGNQILMLRPYVTLDKIEFSKALRPRTMQEILKCQNCKQTFS